MSTSESFHLSYVNKNIKKDAELYPSSVVNDLRKFIEAGAEKDTNGKSLKWKEETISLDENRDYSELWTQKSLRNKEAYEWMLLSEDERKEKIKERQEKRMGHLDAAESKENAVKLPDRVSVYSLSKFLKDPFQFRISQMLMDEDDEDVEKEQFEPVFFNGLDENAVLKKMLAAELSGKEDEYKEFLKDLELKGKLPNGVFGEKQRNALEAKKQVLLDQMNPERVQEVKDKWFFGEKIPDMQISRPDGAYWLLTGKLDWSNAKELKDVTEIFEISSSEEKNISETHLDKFITPYVKALAIIASKSGTEKCAVTISIYSCKKNKNEIRQETVSFTPEEAKDRLRDIYNEAFGEAKFSKCVPVNLLEESSSYTTIYKFKNKLLDEHGPWAYFDKKNLFNPFSGFCVYNACGLRKQYADRNRGNRAGDFRGSIFGNSGGAGK
jgi:exodeoxyribonuclease V gamma subunit